MKLGRGLAVILWFILVGVTNTLVFTLAGTHISFEAVLISSFILAWCNDE